METKVEQQIGNDNTSLYRRGAFIGKWSWEEEEEANIKKNKGDEKLSQIILVLSSQV